MTEVNEVYAGTRKEWRAWLKENHKKKKKVALISYKKHTGKPSISHKESMGEAICFGWIDTTLKRLDEDRYLRYFVRRNDNSKWSQNTLRYGQEMIKKRKMAAEGLRRYNQGLKKPVHDHGIPKNPKTPDYLKKALEKNKTANENFKKLAPSYKRMYLRWLLNAKRPETRNKRVKEIVQRMKENHGQVLCNGQG